MASFSEWRAFSAAGLCWKWEKGVVDTVDKIQDAIQTKHKITFQYYEYTPQKEKILKHGGYRYQFSPYALIWSRDYYYVVGWSDKHEKLAQFRVDRMVAVESFDRAAVCMPDFDPAEYVRKIFGMYPDDLCTVELLCDNEVMRSVIDRFGEDVSTMTADEGHFKAIVEVAPSPPFLHGCSLSAAKSESSALRRCRTKCAAWLHGCNDPAEVFLAGDTSVFSSCKSNGCLLY